MNALDGLPKELVAKMAEARKGTNDPCPVCGVGRGRWCRNADGTNAKSVHPERVK